MQLPLKHVIPTEANKIYINQMQNLKYKGNAHPLPILTKS